MNGGTMFHRFKNRLIILPLLIIIPVVALVVGTVDGCWEIITTGSYTETWEWLKEGWSIFKEGVVIFWKGGDPSENII
jgi:hypothetical protein